MPQISGTCSLLYKSLAIQIPYIMRLESLFSMNTVQTTFPDHLMFRSLVIHKAVLAASWQQRQVLPMYNRMIAIRAEKTITSEKNRATANLAAAAPAAGGASLLSPALRALVPTRLRLLCLRLPLVELNPTGIPARLWAPLPPRILTNP